MRGKGHVVRALYPGKLRGYECGQECLLPTINTREPAGEPTLNTHVLRGVRKAHEGEGPCRVGPLPREDWKIVVL